MNKATAHRNRILLTMLQISTESLLVSINRGKLLEIHRDTGFVDLAE